MRYIAFALGFLLAGIVGVKAAWQPTPGVLDVVSGGVAPSCEAIITGSADGNAILTGTATALANLTCQ